MSEFDVMAQKGGGKERPPAGNHLAVLVGVFSMGTQEDEYNGEIKRQKRALFVWELCGEQIAGTKKNHVIGIDLTLSLHEKAKLRKWLEARTGKPIPDGYTLGEILKSEMGGGCMLNVKLNQGGYPVVDSVAAIPKGVPVPQPTYKLTMTTLEDFKKDAAVIPEWCPWHYGNPLEDHIRASVELGGDKPTRRGKSESSSTPGDSAPAGAGVPF